MLRLLGTLLQSRTLHADKQCHISTAGASYTCVWQAREPTMIQCFSFVCVESEVFVCSMGATETKGFCRLLATGWQPWAASNEI